MNTGHSSSLFQDHLK